MDPQVKALSIPDSKLPYPDSFFGRAKHLVWRGVYPVYTDLRDVLLALHVIRHDVRQPYVLGKLAPGRDIWDFIKYLESVGFANHFVAWMDDGQLLGVRRPDGFEWQYHIRIFKDGEVRGHYEYTPESHPIRHIKELGMEARREDFLKFLGDWITPSSEPQA